MLTCDVPPEVTTGRVVVVVGATCRGSGGEVVVVATSIPRTRRVR